MNDPDSKTAIEEERREAWIQEVADDLALYGCYESIKLNDWIVLVNDFGYEQAFKIAIETLDKERLLRGADTQW